MRLKILKEILVRVLALFVFFGIFYSLCDFNSSYADIEKKVESLSESREFEELEFPRIDGVGEIAKDIYDVDNINLISGLTEDQFDIMFKGTGFENFDKNLFVKIEEDYKVNAILLASIAINECGWQLNSNTISREKNNILSIKAYNKSVNNSASRFESKEECLYYGAGLIKWQYAMSSGKYHNGHDIDHINERYAVNDDGTPNRCWGETVKSIAKKLKSRIDK